MEFSDGFNANVAKQAEFPYASFYLIADGIVIIVYRPYDEDITSADLMTHTSLLEGLNSGKPCRVILDSRASAVNFTPDAREYASTNERHINIIASQALVLSSLAHKMVANFYMRVNKPAFPVKIFKNLKDAYNWSLRLHQLSLIK